MKKGVIYKITSPSQKFYIGKTVDFSSRMSCYRNLNCKDQKAIYASLKKYGFAAHTVEMLYEGPSTTLFQKEIHYIQLHRSFKGENPLGLNLTRGGEGTLGYKQSDETIQKRVSYHIGAKRTLETKQIMSKSAKSHKSNHTGKKHSISTIEKMSKIKQGKVQTVEEIQKRVDTIKKNRYIKYGNILQMDLEGNIIREWEPSIVDVAMEVGCDPTTIGSAIRSNGRKIRLGYKWKYSKK